MDAGAARGTRNIPSRTAFVLLLLALALVLPSTAQAVLSGFNGRIVFASGRDTVTPGDDSQAKLFLRTIDSGVGAGTASPAFTPLAGQHRHPTWSPDRTKVAYARGTPGSATTENFDIFIHDLTTGTVTPITPTGDSLSSDRPAWSPDGRYIVWEEQPTDNNANRYLLRYDVETEGTTNITTSLAPIESKPAWTPDSQRVYFTSGDPTGTNTMSIKSVPVAGSATPTDWPFSPGVNTFQPSISPDGNRICLTMSSGAGFNNTAAIMVGEIANPGGVAVLAGEPGGNFNCTWSPDGTKIAYVAGTFTSGALVMKNADFSGGFGVLEDVPAHFDGNPDWAPDGKPVCTASTAQVAFNTPTQIPLTCADTGPGYEQTDVTESIDTPPASGVLGPVQQGSPATVQYTPAAGFTGTDSFVLKGFDARQFSSPVTITVDVAGPVAGTPQNPGPGADVTRPVLSALSVRPRRWRRGGRLPLAAARKGTTIRFTLSEAAQVTLVFAKARPGRRVAGRCRTPTRANRARRRCTRYVTRGLVRVAGKAGANAIRFQGRISPAQRLGLGRHRVRVRAVDDAGNRSRRRSARFTIVRR